MINNLKPDSNLIKINESRNGQLTRLSGYIGPSNDSTNIRLYIDQNLNNHLSIKKSEIVYTEKEQNNNSDLKRVYIWLNSTSEVNYTSITSTKLQAKFFEINQNRFSDNKILLGYHRVETGYLENNIWMNKWIGHYTDFKLVNMDNSHVIVKITGIANDDGSTLQDLKTSLEPYGRGKIHFWTIYPDPVTWKFNITISNANRIYYELWSTYGFPSM